MKLYDAAGAPNPRRVRIFLAEKGITVPTVALDLRKGEGRAPPHLARNPWGGTPVLELDDGTCIAESVAICRYIEAQHPQPPLMGVDARDQALVEMWNRRVELELFRNFGAYFQHTAEFMKAFIPQQIPAYAELSRNSALARMQLLDRLIADRPFIAGARYTIADITAQCAFGLAEFAGIRINPGLTNLTRWYAEVSSRPSAKA